MDIIAPYEKEWIDAHYSNDDELWRKTLKEHYSPAIVEFIKMNASYVYEHGLNTFEFKKADLVREAIEHRNLNTDKPCDLDAVYYVNEYEREYPNAILAGDTYRDGTTTLCENGSVHVSLYDNELCHSISGGAFPVINPDDLIPNGTKKRLFWTWGSCGSCGNGGIYFTAKVKNWELI